MSKTIALLLIVFASSKSEQFYEKCSDQLQCYEQDMIKYVDKLDTKTSFSILGDLVVIKKIGDDSVTDRRNNEGLIERCIRYLESHELKVRLPARSSRSLTIEARSKKLKKIILPLLLLLKLKAAIVIPAVLSAISLLAFKGFGVSVIALTLAGALGLKSLVETHNHGSKLTYEVVPQIASPHWGRAGIEALPQAYAAVP